VKAVLIEITVKKLSSFMGGKKFWIDVKLGKLGVCRGLWKEKMGKPILGQRELPHRNLLPFQSS
jgi:hypothetical protein